jgi:hypothetical protein
MQEDITELLPREPCFDLLDYADCMEHALDQRNEAMTAQLLLQQLFPSSGNVPELCPSSGNMLEAFPSSGNMLEAFPSSGNMLEAFPSSGNMLEAFPSSGNMLEAFPSSGNMLELFPSSGNMLELFPSSGNMPKLFSCSGNGSMIAACAADTFSQEDNLHDAQVGVERVLRVSACVCTCSSAGNTAAGLPRAFCSCVN